MYISAEYSRNVYYNHLISLSSTTEAVGNEQQHMVHHLERVVQILKREGQFVQTKRYGWI